jgi:hypothetical protein
VHVVHLDESGPPIASEEAGRDLLELGMAEDARWIAVPVQRLGDAFFTLGTGLAGAIVQRLQNYGLGLAVVGDVEPYVSASDSFRALVAESDRGQGSLLFAADAADLGRRLAARGA